MTAARLGRGFLPVALVALGGMVQLATAGPTDAGGWVLLVGAAATAWAMVSYGLRIIECAFVVEPRGRLDGAVLASTIPPLFALYLLAWRGLRELGLGGGASGALLAITFTALGVWVFRGWMRLLEVERLAHTMLVRSGGTGGPA